VIRVLVAEEMSSCSLKEAFTGTRRRNIHATTVSTSRNGAYQNAAFCSQMLLGDRSLGERLRRPEERARRGKRDDPRRDELGEAHAEISKPGLDPERRPLKPLRETTLVLGM